MADASGESLRGRMKVPIMIGISGHRDPREEDVPALKARFGGLLEELAKKYAHSPLRILCSLAEGADQLCAEVALEKSESMDISIGVPLPFPLEMYRRTFDSTKAWENLEAILENENVEVIHLPLPDVAREEATLSDVDLGSKILQDDQLRKRQYELATAYLGSYCDLLVAFWDGKEGGIGGTSQAVKFHREGLPAGILESGAIPNWADTGPVLHIWTPRRSEGDLPGQEPGGSRILAPIGGNGSETSDDPKLGSEAYKVFERICANADGLNRRLEKIGAVERDSFLRSMLKGYEDLEIPEALCDQGRIRAVVGTLARKAKVPVNRVYQVAFGAIFSSLVCWNLYAHAFKPPGEGGNQGTENLFNPGFLFAYIMLFIVGGLISFFFIRSNQEERALDYRALAEAVRVQFYWGVAGLSESAPSNYLRRQRSELGWIRNAISHWAAPYEVYREAFRNLDPSEKIKRLRAVQENWIRAQVSYFQERYESNHSAHKLFRTPGYLLVLFSFLMGVALLCGFPGLKADHPPHHHPNYLLWMGIIVLAGATLIAYGEKRFYAEHARQFASMFGVFDLADVRMTELLKAAEESADQEGAIEVAQELLLELGRDALAENGEWLILHRARPFEMPAGA